jgi:hypothetical protein
MVGKIAISVILAAALFGASTQLSASCILSNAPIEKACRPGCCADTTCCETSQKKTASPVQPLAKPGSDQQSIPTLPSTSAGVVLDQTAAESPVFSSVECTAYSPPLLALICIRLI